MNVTVQARLDPETVKLIDGLAHRLGKTRSQVLRDSVRMMASVYPASAKKKIIGVGRVASGLPDLATTKRYLDDIGR